MRDFLRVRNTNSFTMISIKKKGKIVHIAKNNREISVNMDDFTTFSRIYKNN